MRKTSESVCWFWVGQRGGCWGGSSFTQSPSKRSPTHASGRFYNMGLRLVRRTDESCKEA